MIEFLRKIFNLKSLKIAFVSLLIFVVSVVCLLLIIKSFFSYTLLERSLSKFLGVKIEMTDPKTTFDYKFSANFKAQEVNIYDNQKKIKFVRIKNPQISFKPFGFLFKKAYFKNISAQDIQIKVTRDEKGEIDFLKSLKKINFADLSNTKISLVRLNSKIDKIEFAFCDNYKVKSLTKLTLFDTDIDISKKNKIFHVNQKGTIETNINSNSEISDLSLSINSHYPLNNFNSNNLSLDINLDNVNLFIFNDIAKKYISDDIEKLQGSAALKVKTILDKQEPNQKLELVVKNALLYLKDNKKIVPYKDDVRLSAYFSADKNLITVSEAKLVSNNLSAELNGEILKPFSKKPDINLKTKISNTELNNFLYLIPDNLIFYNPKGIPALKKSNFHAALDGELNVKLFPIDVTGNLKASNIHIPNYPKSFMQNDVSTIFMKDKVRIYTRVYTPSNEYVVIDGVSNLDNSLYGKYSVKSTKKIDLTFAKMYLVPIQQIIGFNLGPVPIMDISGYGSINIKTQGTIEDAQIFGQFEAHDAQAKIEGLDAKLTNGRCRLVFDNRNLYFKEVKGKLEDADFSMTGMGNTKGDVNLNTKIEKAHTSTILKILRNSDATAQYMPLIKDIAAASGRLDADINLSGRIDDYEDISLLNKLALKGNAFFRDNKIILNNSLGVEKLNGEMSFGASQSAKFNFNINNSRFLFSFSSNDSMDKISKGEKFEIKTNISSDKIAFDDILREIKKAKFLAPVAKTLISDFQNINFYTKLNLKSQGKISLNKFNPKDLKHQGFIAGINSELIKDIKFNSGNIKFENNKIIFNNFDFDIYQGKVKMKGAVNDFLSKKPSGDLNISLNNIKLDNINKIIPRAKILKSELKSANVIFRGDTLKFNGVSADYNSMPVFLNAQLKNIYKSQILEADFSTIINEITSDSVINPYLTYPVKIKGEVPIKGTFRGNSSNYTIDFTASVPKNSDISFSGANLGDTNHKREFQGRLDVRGNIASINNLRLIKYIINQNGKTNPITALRADGKLIQKNHEVLYDDFKIVTNTPINVRILNLIFKKSLLKKGNFDCNISLSGNVKSPKINGKVLFQDLDIPLYNTRINDIKVNISDRFINGEILAENKESDLKVLLRALNDFNPPYVIDDINISSNKLNISDILKSIPTQSQKTDIGKKQDIAITPDDIIIKNGSFNFKEVQYEKINAQNLSGNIDYKNSVFHLKDVVLDIAQGKITAFGKYNIKSTGLNLSAKMEQCDSNILTAQFLQLSDQIFGKVNGSAELSAKNLNTPQGIKSLKSNIKFSINNGKMPKLGSLEYLLRAGNLIKNGILGLSLNNIIQVLTPYKTGEFDEISGALAINGGEVEKLQILSKGKNLSLYLDGSYSILENFANIEIYGKLSQNISNALGAVGNASIKQFINSITRKNDKDRLSPELLEKLDKIPSIDIENPLPRFFRAKVLGDINKENYIKSFNWI